MGKDKIDEEEESTDKETKKKRIRKQGNVKKGKLSSIKKQTNDSESEKENPSPDIEDVNKVNTEVKSSIKRDRSKSVGNKKGKKKFKLEMNNAEANVEMDLDLIGQSEDAFGFYNQT